MFLLTFADLSIIIILSTISLKNQPDIFTIVASQHERPGFDSKVRVFLSGFFPEPAGWL